MVKNSTMWETFILKTTHMNLILGIIVRGLGRPTWQPPPPVDETRFSDRYICGL